LHVWWRVEQGGTRQETIGSYAEPGFRLGESGGTVYLVFSDEEASHIRALLKAGELPVTEVQGHR